MQTSKNRLINGSIIYIIGNLSSKILQMLILPVITASLSTSEYGYYDLVITTISLVIPIVTFQMIEGMFRYMFSAEEVEKKQTVSTVTAVLLSGCIILAGILALTQYVIPNLKYPVLVYSNYVSVIVFSYMQKLARCQQKNKAFAISGVINTIVMLGCQALTLLVFNMRIDGMLIANSVSYFVASIYLLTVIRVERWISIKSINKAVFKDLFKFSAPLIPNSLCWWLISSSNRYIIAFFIGTAANGIYSIAGKFSQLLTFATGVFQLAWQESAIIETDNIERDKFYSVTFNTYMKLLLSAYLFTLPFIKIIIPILLEKEYQPGYLYNPLLLLGAIFAAFSQFYGSAYLVFKKTSGAFYTTVIAAVINLAFGVGLISSIGLFAPAVGTLISFFVQWLVRAYQLRDCFKVRIETKPLFLLVPSILGVTYLYYIDSTTVQATTLVFGLLVFCIINKRLIREMLRRVHLGVGK